MRRTTMLVACTLALALCAGYAVAATTPGPDTLKVDYFSNANTAGAPDGTFRIINPGTAGGSLCAAIYVFDTYQELSECCSCYLSPDALDTLSVNSDLTDNPLTGVTLSTGVIKVVSTAVKGGSCPYYPSSLTPTAGLRSWMTHIQNSSFTITETASQDATLSAAEVSRLQSECYAIQLDGSGRGRCYCDGSE
jgi:hypothetical protein